MAALQLVGGDEVIEPFLLEHTNGLIVDLDTMEPLIGGVWWRGRKRISISEGAGIIINTPHPERAAEGEHQVEHGTVTLTEDQTLLLPFGQIASLRIVCINGDGVTMSTFLHPLERIT